MSMPSQLGVGMGLSFPRVISFARLCCGFVSRRETWETWIGLCALPILAYLSNRYPAPRLPWSRSRNGCIAWCVGAWVMSAAAANAASRN
ncbi:hypothetical protein IF1G_05326 [Cordyceps javanica]|uniref:Uncharacterized protein n=1 Tax=Cordyceps javanica TaxID=43265 RepID=A0A545V1C7_9HYPO|nr:hypothetical protein IF1G_05326 [Cordyceps javanica]